ncbi:MAG: hypothetical protein HY237_03435 [Acidobacteria bacterium]|nr:hypothetical protein [Acidobacteriota bacterium]
MLKAMGRPERRSAVITASMSLDEICEKLMMAQIEDAIPAETRARAFLNGQSTPEEDKDAKKKFAAQRRVGIPDIHDPNRAGKVEHILQDMVEAGKLRFYPPDRYSIE